MGLVDVDALDLVGNFEEAWLLGPQESLLWFWSEHYLCTVQFGVKNALGRVENRGGGLARSHASLANLQQLFPP